MNGNLLSKIQTATHDNQTGKDTNIFAHLFRIFYEKIMGGFH